MIETLLNKPCWIVDFLPERVPEGSAGQFFAVEKYFLRQPAAEKLRSCYTEILLKLNCYSDLRVSFADSEESVLNPAPELLASWIHEQQKDLCILLPDENALITLYRDDACMAVFNPPEALLNRIGCLASANGLFLRRAGE